MSFSALRAQTRLSNDLRGSPDFMRQRHNEILALQQQGIALPSWRRASGSIQLSHRAYENNKELSFTWVGYQAADGGSQTYAPGEDGSFLALDTSSPRSNGLRSVVGERECHSIHSANSAGERLSTENAGGVGRESYQEEEGKAKDCHC
jgi:hypothetical protein